MRHLALLLLAALACDPIPPPADLPPPPPGCGAEAGMFGPCSAGYGCIDEIQDLSCLQPTDQSSICVAMGSEPSIAVQACAASLGPLSCSHDFGFCTITCPSGLDLECGGDMACDPTSRLCVWPGAIPPGGTTGEMPPDNPSSTSTDG